MLSAYAANWDARAEAQRPAGPRCPDCGAPIEPRQYYVGGKGYLFFEVCSGDGAHYGKRIS